MGNALSVYQVLKGKPNLMQFEGIWEEAIGHPEMAGSWIIWGQSFNGKTSFAMMLARYLTKFDKVLYNSMEEGASRSIQIALERAEMQDVAKRFNLLEGEDIDELIERLSHKKQPRIVIMDSLQYSSLNYDRYKLLKRKFPKTLWIWISHAEGRLPEGRLANRVRYDSMVKIHIEGYRAFINSRFKADYNPHNYITIWEEGAKRYWGENYDDNNIKTE